MDSPFNLPIIPPEPDPNSTPLKFIYTPSSDFDNSNLLVLFHGLGDTEIPFSNLATRLRLPKTATLCIRGPYEVPYLDSSYQWFPSFDLSTGDMLSPVNTSLLSGLRHTRKLIAEFLDKEIFGRCGFKRGNVVFFGFSQGGSVALEVVCRGNLHGIAGVVSIGGYLINTTRTQAKLFEGDILVVQGEKDDVVGRKDAAKKFNILRNFVSPSSNTKFCLVPDKGHDMPRSEAEWRTIHTFLAKHLSGCSLQSMPDIFEVKKLEDSFNFSTFFEAIRNQRK